MSSNDTPDFSADAIGSAPVSAVSAEEQLSRIGRMADVLTQAQKDVAAAEADLLDAEDALGKLTRMEFPELLRECGLTEVKLKDKRTIILLDELQCGITKENKPAAHAWLRDGGYGGLIKTSLVIEFAKGDEEKMQAAQAILHTLFSDDYTSSERIDEIAAQLDEGGRHFGGDRKVEAVEGVHWQTLKSFVKELREAGKTVPTELFNLFEFSVVNVKHPKGASDAFKLKRIYKKKSASDSADGEE